MKEEKHIYVPNVAKAAQSVALPEGEPPSRYEQRKKREKKREKA